MEQTLAILKPDSYAAGNTGRILAHLEAEGFTIRGLRIVHLTQEQAGAFYAVHAERPFYGSLVDFMTSGPCVPVALERENGVKHLRQIMGATNPAEAAEGTIRKQFATNIENNAIHGSDSAENAQIELAFFFSSSDLIAAQ
ncbi:MAG: nucleoside-diphosphate kinase [Thermoanaerobaculia bacterium]|nr:nucleoside-diphosphate kinase [Thermoanaerobaculia bacterium]